MADLENVGKNVAEKASNTASQASNAASNAASKTSENLNNVATQAANNTSTNNSQVTGNVSNGKVNANKPDSVNHETNNNLTDAEERKAEKQRGKQLYNTEGASARYNEDMTPEEKKAFEKERAAHNTAEAINASADVAASSGNAYAKAFGYIHKGLNDVTGGQYGEAVGKVTSGVNRLMPGGKTAQKAVNSAVESGAAKAVGDALAAKNGDGAKKAGEEVAKDAAEEKAKDVAEDASKKIADNAKNAAANRSGKVDYESDGAKILKNPISWTIMFFVLIGGVLFSIILFTVVFVTTKNSKGNCTQFPYVEMDYYKEITVKDPNTGDSWEVPLEDYVAGVIAHEVKGFADQPEMLKSQAVAARTYAEYMMSYKGYVWNSTNDQMYSPDEEYITPGNVFYEAAHDTAGVVIINYVNDKPSFVMTQYDALAISESCGGEENEAENYVITCQKHIKVPLDWLKSNMIESDYNFFTRRAYHGNGMSQWGAYYLVSFKGYDFKQILELFYDEGQIISLYPTSNCAFNLEIMLTPDDAEQLVHTSVEDFLKSKGRSIKEVNDGLRDAVIAAGPGTRAGVETAAVYLINTFLEYNVRLPYQMSGGWAGDCTFDCPTYAYYGINPHWGSAIADESANYNSLGMDCASFVTWAFHTGGLTFPTYIPQFGYLDDEHVDYYDIEDVDKYRGQPGDFIYHPGHVMLILDYYNDGEEEGYYIAEASGWKNDIQVIKRSISDLSGKNNVIGDMSYHYQNSRVSDYKQAFDEGRLD